MIYIGLTGWGDHDSLNLSGISSRNRLQEYAAFFPTVEVDPSFYAIQPLKNAQKWVDETPDGFQFIVKAYQGMTLHQRRETTVYETRKDMFDAFKDSLTPYIKSDKLAMVLFQFPPWFDCRKENVQYLRWCKAEMGNIPCALEFRHQSWFQPNYYYQTLQFMKSEGWIHSICDEPQAGSGSVPTVLVTTSAEKVLIRFHGRNVHGWQKKSDANWREVRYLYRYNEEELTEWASHLTKLKQDCKHVYVVFNNNSGGDAADNGKQLIQLMNLEYKNLAPRQLDLFS